MSDLLLYTIVSVIVFAIGLLVLREYFRKKEELLFTKDRVFVTSSSPYRIIWTPIIVFGGAWFLSLISFDTYPNMWFYLAGIGAVAVISVSFTVLKWVHFTQEKIIIHNPITNHETIIAVSDIVGAGYKDYGKGGSYYFIEIKNANQLRRVFFNRSLIKYEDELLDYFVSKGIKFRTLGLFDLFQDKI